MLLEETRKRGIPDDDVHKVIASDEVDAAHGFGDDYSLQCLRSAAGVPFINCLSGTGGESLVSSNELFSELGTAESESSATGDDVAELGDTGQDTSPPDASEVPSIRDQVHDAFDHVGMGLSCLLPVLLKETRERGIHDDDVKGIIQSDEYYGVNGNGFHCERTAQGVGFVTVSSGGGACRMASANELFAELEDQTQSDSSVFHPPSRIVLDAEHHGAVLSAGPLADVLKRENLTDAEIAILETAQVMSNRFSRSRPVEWVQLQRVVVSFRREISNDDFEAALYRLVSREIVEVLGGCPRLVRLTRETSGSPRQKTKFSRLQLSELEEDLLVACNQCSCKDFRKGGLVPRHAVLFVMMARHCRGRTSINKTIARLIATGIIEEVPGKSLKAETGVRGQTGLKLTNAARLVIRGHAETVAEDVAYQDTTAELPRTADGAGTSAHEDTQNLDTPDESLASTSEPKAQTSGVPDIEFGRCEDYSPMTRRVVAIAVSLCEIHSVEITQLFIECEKRGIRGHYVKRALGELAAVENLCFVEGLSGKTYVEFMNIDTNAQITSLGNALYTAELALTELSAA